MSWTLPPETKYSFKKGSEGIVVWAIQKALNATFKGPGLVLDGNYGTRTKNRVTAYQHAEGLFEDGIFGPASSLSMAASLEEKLTVALPAHLIQGFVKGESDGYIGAVNWSVPGGVDCSYLQRRVYGPPLYDVEIERAFDGLYQCKLLATNLRNRHNLYFGRPGAKTHERAWRLASLYHNYQYAAEKLSEGPWETPYSTSPQEWVEDIGAHFKDGTAVRTPRQWCDFYALGSPEHNDLGSVTRYVTDWTP